jgi:hypothetical protein
MDDLREALERAEEAAGRADLPRDSHERFLRYRDRKRRNQRFATIVVTVVIFVAPIAWTVATDDLSGRAHPPLRQGPSVTPSETRPVGLIGLAPAGAAPSSPRKGDALLRVVFGHSQGDPGRFAANVYADGRVIWERLDGTGLLEQRLTAEGVELVRNTVISTGLFDHDVKLLGMHGLYFGSIQVRDGDRLASLSWGDATWGPQGLDDVPEQMATPEQREALRRLEGQIEDLASWVPARAWERRRIEAFVPSGYSVCFGSESTRGLDGSLASFPRQAVNLIRAHEVVGNGYTNKLGTHTSWCVDMTTEEARALDHALSHALDGEARRYHRDAYASGVSYRLFTNAPGLASEIQLDITPLLPDEV